MTVFIIRRLLQSFFVLVAMTVIVFAAVYAIGNPVDILIAPDATQAERTAAIARLGLDQPLYQQYISFVGNLLQGDVGRSFVFNVPAFSLVLSRLPATLELAIFALFLSILVGIPLGLWAGLKPHSAAGHSIMVGSIFGFSLPNFWQGLMLILLFAVLLGWLPSGGRGEPGEFLGMHSTLFSLDGWSHLILPSINLALFKTALIIRLTRASVLEAIQLDFVKFARAKGLREGRIVGVHILKVIMIPVITIIGLEFGTLIAFAVVTETVFAWPGIGKLIIDSIFVLDRPVIVSYLIVIVLTFITINLIVDVLYSVFDPRVRLQDLGT